MFVLLRIKKIIIKLLTFWILSKSWRKNVRNFLYYFSFIDYMSFRRQNFYIVSLGESCFTRALLTAIKLKPRKLYGEKTCPFDLCFTRDLERTSELIENDFSDFFENLDMNNFPHDKHLSETKFRKRYERRINNFLAVQNSDKKVYYVYSNFSGVTDKNKIEKLYNVLKNKRKDKPFQLILLISNPVNVENVIEIVEDFRINDSKVIQYLINEYREYDNEYTKLEQRLDKKLKKVISNNPQKSLR